jgi:allantoicase
VSLSFGREITVLIPRHGLRGHSGQLDHVEIDTNHFKGNYPESCELHACYSEEVSSVWLSIELVKNGNGQIKPVNDEIEWTAILPRHKLGPHRRHFFQLENVADKSFTHVRVTIHPDGGIKRVRVMGRRGPLQITTDDGGIDGTTFMSSNIAPGVQASILAPRELAKTYAMSPITALPLTTEAFAPFGQVLMAWTDPNAAPKGVVVTSANQNTAHKYHNLSQIERSYPPTKDARTGFSVYRSTPAGAKPGDEWEVKIMERHPYTNQAFIPMGYSGMREDELPSVGRAYLVVVALNGQDDKPDLQTLRAFVAAASQGIVYNTGVWRKYSTSRDCLDKLKLTTVV